MKKFSLFFALALAASVELESEHPIAKAIVTFTKSKKLQLVVAKHFSAMSGRGAKALVGTDTIYVGGPRLIEELSLKLTQELESATTSASNDGKTVVYVIKSKKVIGAIMLTDVIRPESKKAVQTLQKAGKRVAILTGDANGVAAWVSKELGITEFFAEVLPEHKADVVKKLQADAGKHVDHSISSTVNLPADVSVEEVDKIYRTAWKKGCKGITVYRDGCRTGILVKKESGFNKNNAPKRPKTVDCDIYHTKSRGEDFFVLVGLLNGHPYEIFAGKNGCISHEKKGKLTKNKRGHYSLLIDDKQEVENVCDLLTDEQAVITRLISLSLRHGSDISFVVDQLEKSHGDMTNFGKALARVLKKYIKDGTKIAGRSCESCGSENVIRQEGCASCKDCGSSKCS
jgi:ribonucleotide reductase alpha subunit